MKVLIWEILIRFWLKNKPVYSFQSNFGSLIEKSTPKEKKIIVLPPKQNRYKSSIDYHLKPLPKIIEEIPSPVPNRNIPIQIHRLSQYSPGIENTLSKQNLEKSMSKPNISASFQSKHGPPSESALSRTIWQNTSIVAKREEKK